MARENLNDLLAFLAVARERSFTKAAAQLGVSQSALSHTIRGLEARLGLRLLTRTTRSVAPTEAGERLFQTIAPRIEDIETELAALSTLRDKPAGTIRISTAEHAADTVLWPKLEIFLPEYPDIKVELNIDYAFTDIVAQRFDMGVRLGESVAKDMIAVRIGPDMRMSVVGSPTYFSRISQPKTPHDLAAHNCINLRLPTYGSLLPWEFEKDKQQEVVRVNGQFISNIGTHILRAAMAGLGLAYLPQDMVQKHLDDGTLISVLEEWCPTFPGYYLYYPSRRQQSPALTLLVDALRFKR
ncbi:MAG: LysR family transcriptional regulator [Burkholderiaceae bacterium]|nr:LysR family transcriptional regulator [Burkholderiaceae bacterium]